MANTNHDPAYTRRMRKYHIVFTPGYWRQARAVYEDQGNEEAAEFYIMPKDGECLDEKINK